MKKILSLFIAILMVLLLCACGAQSPKATAPYVPNIPTIPPEHPAGFHFILPKWMMSFSPYLEPIFVQVRLQMVTENGTPDYINLQALAVENKPDFQLNVVNDVDHTDIQEIWIRSDDLQWHHVDCCQSYYPCENDGWTKITCVQNHQDIKKNESIFQLVYADENGTHVKTLYMPLSFS